MNLQDTSCNFGKCEQENDTAQTGNVILTLYVDNVHHPFHITDSSRIHNKAIAYKTTSYVTKGVQTNFDSLYYKLGPCSTFKLLYINKTRA